MINILHLYYDLLNLYGENANVRCIKHNLEINNIKVEVDLKSINDDINFNKYDIIYIGSGSEDNLLFALSDIIKRKNDLKKYIESNKYLILTGNSMDLFGKYIETFDKKINALNIFNYYSSFLKESTFKNASKDRIVGEVYANTKLIDNKVIGFQNRSDLVFNVKTPLFEVTDKRFSNSLKDNYEGFYYKNVYASHIIGPILIRNPYFNNYLLNKICREKNIKYKLMDDESIEAYKKYLGE